MAEHLKERGQALVEFSLVIIVFIPIVFGIFDGGRLIFAYNAVANAAREGARVAIVNQSTSGTDTCDTTSATAWAKGCAISSAFTLGLTEADVDVTYRNPTDDGPCTNASIGCLAVVTATHQFNALTPVIGQWIGPVTVSSTAKMPIERVCTNPTTSPIAHC
jgi:Flp pilus assembly protein TadG